jgi:hypothetical protein
MVNMPIYHLLKTWWGKLDDIAYSFVDIDLSKTLYEKPQKNSHKDNSTMHHMSQYHPPKTPMGKMGHMT